MKIRVYVGIEIEGDCIEERGRIVHRDNIIADNKVGAILDDGLDTILQTIAPKCDCRDAPGRVWSRDCPVHGEKYKQSKGQKP